MPKGIGYANSNKKGKLVNRIKAKLASRSATPTYDKGRSHRRARRRGVSSLVRAED